MKTLLLLILFFSLFTMKKEASQLTEAERKFAVDQLGRTKKRLLKYLNGLTAVQLNFKPDSTQWSVAECVEHIALSEARLGQLIRSIVKTPADSSKKAKVKWNEQDILKMMTDRSKKAEAPESIRPGNKFSDTEAAIQAFTEEREKMINYVKTTQDDLRNRFFDHPIFGTLDLYVWIVLVSGHCERHTLQLEEVITHPKFPWN